MAIVQCFFVSLPDCLENRGNVKRSNRKVAANDVTAVISLVAVILSHWAVPPLGSHSVRLPTTYPQDFKWIHHNKITGDIHYRKMQLEGIRRVSVRYIKKGQNKQDQMFFSKNHLCISVYTFDGISCFLDSIADLEFLRQKYAISISN